MPRPGKGALSSLPPSCYTKISGASSSFGVFVGSRVRSATFCQLLHLRVGDRDFAVTGPLETIDNSFDQDVHVPGLGVRELDGRDVPLALCELLVRLLTPAGKRGQRPGRTRVRRNGSCTPRDHGTRSRSQTLPPESGSFSSVVAGRGSGSGARATFARSRSIV